MNCKNCSALLPDDANFCVVCGMPQREGVTPYIQDEAKFETCEIMLSYKREGENKLKPIVCWVALAYGEKGNYNAAESNEFIGDIRYFGKDGHPTIPYIDLPEIILAHEVLSDLVDKLQEDGWSFICNYKDAFYAMRFRRQIK